MSYIEDHPGLSCPGGDRALVRCGLCSRLMTRLDGREATIEKDGALYRAVLCTECDPRRNNA